MGERVHVFTDDALGDLDAVGVAARIRAGEISAAEAVAAATARTLAVQPKIGAVQVADFAGAAAIAREELVGEFAGVPTFIKDNVNVRGLPTGQGSQAYTAAPVSADDEFVNQFLALGFVRLGKTTLPEFGFNASTEYGSAQEPTRNPWNIDYSAGGSSGGAAALVAAGAVPIAHGNDGGGSTRIPAAVCGLVGLKPSRGRLRSEPRHRLLPVDIVTDGVLSRSVRDTAHFFAAMERVHRHKRMRRIGLVEGAGTRRLNVGLIVNSVIEGRTDDETRATMMATAELLASLGHTVTEVAPPVDPQFADDFILYWGMLSTMITSSGRMILGKDFAKAKTDNLTRGLDALFRSRWRQGPGALRRLRASAGDYERFFESFDVALCPVLGHTTPPIGHFTPEQPFEDLIAKLRNYVSFTPLNNVTGAPAISLPMGETATGLPIGVQFLGGIGEERLLLELAYELEAAQPFRRIQDA